MQTWWRSANELDEDQRNIMSLPPDGSFVLRGPPGSGKTNLLLMRAAYLTSLRRNIAVVVLNRSLAEFIRSGAQAYGLDPNSVFTSRGLVTEMAREAGITLDKNASYESGREEALQALINIHKKTNGPIYDAIFVDEAQDHNAQEIQALRALTRDLFLTTDSRQMIYAGGTAADRFTDIVDDVKTLNFHYRCSHQICDLADSIGKTFTSGYERIAPSSRYPLEANNEMVRVYNGNLSDQANLIGERLAGQVRAYRGELIGVFAPRREDVAFIAGSLRDLGLGDLLTVQSSDEGYFPLDVSRPICLSTVHGAKGLEFQAVHFAAAETVRSCGANQKRVAFTGVTRAKSSLSIYHDGQLPGYLNAALEPYKEQAVITDWTSIFNARN
ncbi:ATP-binding domain-containing protein [Pantoea sp. DY-5]|uniref:ATP-binding domain-containing protein n=1 Tax=Pantoea sp. DY-5 TaxID=2871488 RepID=UPI001C97B38D|nr:ATP-binding domain-containing protein [Pantoea sp. DY-5]MBY4839564.1 AAA family ATPase [Pantoea sp. DY-5]